MNQPTYMLDKGTRIVTHEKLGDTKGMMIAYTFLDARIPNARGTIEGAVPGHGGDVYWVQHDGAQAAYCFDEFELDTTGAE